MEFNLDPLIDAVGARHPLILREVGRDADKLLYEMNEMADGSDFNREIRKRLKASLKRCKELLQ